jgi:hypothetical protein
MTEIAQRYPHGRAAHDRARRGASRARAHPGLVSLALKIAVVAGVLCLAGCPVAYILWPRWPDSVSLDAPALPITVGGMLLNVPPAAIRLRIQRRTGAQERVDLAFLWPSLAPPDPAVKPASAETLQQTDRIFLTIASSDGAPTQFERLKTIYPRYSDGDATLLPNGLKLQTFRSGTPYQNEDLLYDAAAPERFIVRCTRQNGLAPGVCLHERRIGAADITFRFPRDWLNDWRGVESTIDRLIANLRSTAPRS